MLNNLDEQSLSNCKEASRVVSHFVIQERFYWIRIIQKYYKNLCEFKRSWKIVTHRTSTGILKQLAIAVHCFFTTRLRASCHWSPFHIAAGSGDMQLCTHVYQKIHQLENKNPENKKGWNPLHVAALSGHVDICVLIMHHLENKNPSRFRDYTPLHLSAQNGHLEICRLITDMLEDKNP